MSLLDFVQQQLGPAEISRISQQLNVDPNKVQNAISAALPMMLGGMARHAAQPEGADAIKQELGAHQNTTEVVTAPESLLNRVFGPHRDVVQQGVQQAGGLDSSRAKTLLTMLSPLVLGLIARRKFGVERRPDQAAASEIGDTLEEEARAAKDQAPHLGGLLGSLFGAR